MSNTTSARPGDTRLRFLVEAYCNGALTDAEFAELEQRLSQDAAARDLYLRYAMLDSAVRDFAENSAGAWSPVASEESNPAKPDRLPRQSFRHWSPALIAVALLLIAVAAWSWLQPRSREPKSHPRAICVLDQLRGRIAIASSDGTVRPGRSGAELSAGDTVRTQETQSAATLAYLDGSRLSLVGKSSITLNGEGPKSITVHQGSLFASVTPQPARNPMRVATHTDSLEILGTRFMLDATADSTDVRVTEGRIRLTRSSDGNSVEVPAGQRVVSSVGSALVLETIPVVPAEWTEDFEDGLPEEWGAGKLIATDSPLESQAAVQSVRVPTKDGGPFEVSTAHAWTHGLFAVHDDSHLHFTFKMRSPGWLNILILTRTADGDPPAFAGNYLYDEAEWWQVEPDHWATVSIPLSAFRPLPPAREGFENAVPFQLLFSSPEGDRGLVLDQVAVKRGGPGRVVIKEYP